MSDDSVELAPHSDAQAAVEEWAWKTAAERYEGPPELAHDLNTAFVQGALLYAEHLQRNVLSREQLEAVIDEYEDEAAEGHCDCGNYRIDPDELSARVWALLQGGTK